MRLVKGAKETFGWVIVGIGRKITVPLKAWERYQFRAGEEAVFITGSRKSGGFGLTNHNLLSKFTVPLSEKRLLGYGRFNPNREVVIPENISVQPGERLLTVFGSGSALGFISRGPIYEEAVQHPELDELNKE